MKNYHASCVAFGPIGVLIRGASGAGKSTLALQLIDGAGYGFAKTLMRGQLVADDQVLLRVKTGKLTANPPPALAGLLEIRGLGIIQVKFKKSVTVKLVVDLVPHKSIERMPELSCQHTEIEGVSLPRITIAIGNFAAPAILRAALHNLA